MCDKKEIFHEEISIIRYCKDVLGFNICMVLKTVVRLEKHSLTSTERDHLFLRIEQYAQQKRMNINLKYNYILNEGWTLSFSVERPKSISAHFLENLKFFKDVF